MSTVSFVLGFLARRVRAQWPLVLAILMGCLVVVAAMTGAVLYPDAVDQVGLQHTLAQRKPEELHVQVSAYYLPPRRDAFDQTSRLMESALRRDVPWFYTDAIRSGISSTFYMAQPDASVPQDQRPRAAVAYIAEPTRHIKVIRGAAPEAVRVPAARGESGAAAEIQALAFQESAERFGLDVGAEVTLLPTWGTNEPPLRVRITGIAERQSPADPFWTSEAASAMFQPKATYPHLALVTPQDTFLDALGRSYPDMTADYWWFLPVNRTQVRPTNAPRVRDGLEALNRELSVRVRRSRVVTSLDRALNDYSTKREFSRVPLALFTALVVGAAMYYLVLAASVLLERQSSELALLRSRGAGLRQLMALLAAQAVAVVLPAALLGPPLALAFVSLLGLAGPLAAQTGGQPLPAALSSNVVTVAAVGAALGFVVILTPAVNAARRTTLSLRAAQARPSGRLMHHISLDLILAAVALVLWLDLSQRGSFLARRLFGQGPVADALLLLAPALALAAALALSLRLLPLLLGALASLAQRLPSPALLLTLRYMAREPLLATGPLALLAIASAMLVFAASFGATLERSYRDRAAYEAGADLRVVEMQSPSSGPSQPIMAGLEPRHVGAEATSPALRERGAILTGGLGASFNILGVDPGSIPDVAYYRADFSPSSLRAALPPLAATPVTQGRALPRDARRLGLWVRPAVSRPDLSLFVRLSDANGHVFSFPLGNLGFREWRFMETDMTPRQREGARRPPMTPVHPLSLQAIYIASLREPGLAEPGALFLDSLRVTGDDGRETLVEGFEDLSPWSVLENPSIPQKDFLPMSEAIAREGVAAQLTWGPGSPTYARGIYLGVVEAPLPVIASDAFLSNTGFRVGDEPVLAIRDVPIRARIVGRTALFPTMYPEADDFLVAGLEPLRERLNLKTTSAEVLPDELWVRSSDPARVRASLQALRQSGTVGFSDIREREKLVTSYRLDPLIAAGWAGMLVIAFAAVLLVGATGFVIYAAATAERRRTLFGVLRAVGFSPRQVRAMVWVDHGLVGLLGLAIGTALGAGLGGFFLRFMEVTERGGRVTPPFVLQVDWAALGIAYAILGAVMGTAVGVASAAFMRQAVGRALRWTGG